MKTCPFHAERTLRGHCCGKTFKRPLALTCTRSIVHLGAHVACGDQTHFLGIEFTTSPEYITYALMPILFSPS